MKLYFVCTGNICRSSFAHWYCEKQRAERGLDDLSVASFGTMVDGGLCVPDEAIEVAAEFEVDLTQHSPTAMQATLLHGDALYLVMERKHADAILRLNPMLQGNVTLIGEYARDVLSGAEIADPWRKSSYYYRVCYSVLAKAIDRLLDDLA